MRLACLALLALFVPQDKISDTDATHFELLVPLEGHSSSITKMRSTRDYKHFITMAADGLRVWDSEKLSPVSYIPDVVAFDMDPGGYVIGVCKKSDTKTIAFYEVPSLKPRKSITCDIDVGQFQYIPETTKIFLGGAVPTIVNSETGKKLADAFKEVTGTQRAYFGKGLAAFSFAGEVRLFNLGSGAMRKSLKFDAATVEQGCFDAQAKVFVGTAGDKVRVWDAQTSKDIFTAKDHTGYINDIAISVNGKYLATAATDKTVHVYNITGAGRHLCKIDAHSDNVTAITFTQDNKALITTGADRAVRLWDPEKGTLLADFGMPYYFTCVAAGANDRFYFGDNKGQVRPYDMAARRFEPPIKAHTGNLTAVAAAKDGSALATGGTDQVMRVCGPDGKELFKFDKAGAEPKELRFAADGKTVYLTVDNKVLSWALPGGEMKVAYLDEKDVIAAFDVSPDGKTLWVVDRNRLHVVDLATGKDTKTEEKINGTGAYQAAISPKGEFLYRPLDTRISVCDAGLHESGRMEGPAALDASYVFGPEGRAATGGGTDILVWDIAGANTIKKLSGREKWKRLAWSPSGRFIAGVSENGYGAIFGVKPPEPKPKND